MDKPKSLVLTGFGVNCDSEMCYAFELAGAESRRVHLEDLVSRKVKLEDFHILSLPGGFSYGDDIASGKVYANKLKYNLFEDLCRFIQDGKLIIGVCNGFQMLVKMGLLPGLDGDYKTQTTTLTFNDSGRFESRWVFVKVNQNSRCIFTRGIDVLPVPIRHGEGKFIPASEEVLRRLHSESLIVLQYCGADGNITDEYPLNPNGSVDAIAGICDPTGRVFGLMPHPEAYLFKHNNPQWPRDDSLPMEGKGLRIFQNAVNYIKEEF